MMSKLTARRPDDDGEGAFDDDDGSDEDEEEIKEVGVTFAVRSVAGLPDFS
jgi:hypothetical protein